MLDDLSKYNNIIIEWPKRRNIMTAIIILAVIGMIIQGCFIAVEHKEKYVLADILKGCAAFMFVCIGFISYLKVTNDSLGLKIVVGLVFGMIGDILLNLRFVLKENGQKAFGVKLKSNNPSQEDVNKPHRTYSF